jgi:predicted nucleic acid-binding Zn ribbon protein
MVTRVYKCTNEYCEKFDETFDVKQRITADKLVTCELCNEDTLVTVIQPSNFNLSGGGWTGSNIAGGGR